LTPFPDLTLTKSLVSSLDDQALIDGLVFEAWRTADEARSWILGAELTLRWVAKPRRRSTSSPGRRLPGEGTTEI